MAMAHMKVIFSLGIASLLVACTCAHEFVKFGYGGAIGPDKWGSLSPEYKLCSEGKHQSPINIVKNDMVYDPKLEILSRNYPPTKATLINNGFYIELLYEGAVGKVTVAGKEYSLIQMHWHSPSEHTIDGERFPVELHLIHQSNDGSITVVAILYKIGGPDAFLLQLKDEMDKLAKETCSADEEAHVPVGIVQTRSLMRSTRKYFRYVGSFTIPPCTENVVWNILGKVREMTVEQVNALKAPLAAEYRNNSRPTQKLNGRTVQLYDESQNEKSH